MSRLTATIPFDKISKIKVYVNAGHKSLTKIKRDLGCDYLLNAGLFDLDSFQPMNLLVSGGIAYAKSTGKFGMSFFDEHAVLSYENQVKYPEHVSAYPCLLKSGGKAFCRAPAGLGGKRGRSAIGYGTHALVLYLSLIHI